MPDRFGDGSHRWSGQDERDARDRQRKTSDALKASGSRRKSWRDGASAANEPTPEPTAPSQASPSSERPTQSSTPRTTQVTDRWRREAGTAQQDDGAELPPLPGQDRRRGGSISSRGVLLGAVLLALVLAMMYLPFGPLGGGGDDSDPTSPAVVPTNPVQDPAARDDVVSTPEPATTIDSDMLVCIDPGHGGWDLGQQRLDQELFAPPLFHESEVNLAMAFMLRDELESRGIGVVMTRESGTAANIFSEDVNGDGRTILDGKQHGDRDELQRRINICNEAGADILISLHINYTDDQTVRGYEVFYTSNREFGDVNIDLANFVYREMGGAFATAGYETNARGPKDDLDLSASTHEFGAEQHLVMTGPAVENPDYTIVPSAMPGVIVEAVFMSNQDDANFIVNPENQRLLVVAYADGIERYFEQYPPD